MPNASKQSRKINTKPTTTTPVRGITSPAPRAIKPAAAQSAPSAKAAATLAANIAAAKAGTSSNVAPKAATPIAAGSPAPAANKPPRGLGSLNRQLAVVAAAKYPFGSLSDADSQYLALFAAFAKASKSGTFTLAAVRDSAARPTGITINNNAARALRLAKAGYLSGLGTDASPFVITANGKARAEYTTAKPLA